jgi:predicted kinase
MLTGLQGTGKSTIARNLARELKFPLFAKDHFETTLFNDKLTDGASISSYHLMLATADLHLNLGITCILDAVFPLAGFRNRARDIAADYRAELRIIYTYCSDEQLHRQRLESRVSLVPWERITWLEMIQTKAKFEAWSSQEALFLDAVNPLETNIQKALQYIDKSP